MEQGKCFKHLELLTEALIDLYYIVVSLGAYTVHDPRIILRGIKINLPLRLVYQVKLLKTLSGFLKDLYLILRSPSRIIAEELRISNIPEGRLNVPLTSRLLGSGLALIATYRRRLSLETLENILVKAALYRFREDLEKWSNEIENFSCDDVVYETLFKSLTKSLVDELENMIFKINRILNTTFLRHIKVKPHLLSNRALKKLALKVAEKKIEPYYSIALKVLEYLREDPIGVLSKAIRDSIEIEKLRLGFWDYKLYEVYIYFVLLYTLTKELKAREEHTFFFNIFEDEAQYITSFGDLIVTYDKVPKCKSWISHGKTHIFNNDKIDIPSGRPDFTFQLKKSNNIEKIIAVSDAKYRVSYRELSQSRFKILGYMHEYNVPVGALFYDPTLIELVEDEDKEAMDHIRFLKDVSKTSGIAITDSDRIFFIIPLRPMKHTDLVKSRNYPVLCFFIDSTLKHI